MSKSSTFDPHVRRLDAVRVQIDIPGGVPCVLFARDDVFVEPAGIQQLLEFASIHQVLAEIWHREQSRLIPPFWGERPGRSQRQIVLTPDFHKGSGIPVGTVADTRGFVVPAAIGNDICCGMRLLVTDATREELLAAPAGAGRSGSARSSSEESATFRCRPASGRRCCGRDSPDLHETRADNAGTGLWRSTTPAQQATDLGRVHFEGALPTTGHVLVRRLHPRLGRIGRTRSANRLGGRRQPLRRAADRRGDLRRPDRARLGRGARRRRHHGALGLGRAGPHGRRALRERSHRRFTHPRCDATGARVLYLLPTWGPHAARSAEYLDAMRNAANFAFANRLFLGLMAVRALRRPSAGPSRRSLVERCAAQPHLGGRQSTRYLHRKGACPALGAAPGSAGRSGTPGIRSSSPARWGHRATCSLGPETRRRSPAPATAPAEASRAGSRPRRRGAVYAEAMARVARRHAHRRRGAHAAHAADILAQDHQRLKEEAPYAYKPITPVIATIEDAGIARRVARLWPLVTVKG